MIGPGKRILLVGRERTYFIRSGTGQFSTDRGIINLDEVADASPGELITSHSGYEFRILVPRAHDFFEYARRTGAPMLPRDIGLVIAYTGMNRTDRVLDAGTGTGIAAIYFGGIVQEVVTYEIREDFARIAEANIQDAGLETVEVVAGDVLQAE